MAKKRPSAPAESTPEHPLACQLERLADEVQLLRTVLDEIRSDFQWAVQNGRISFRIENSPEEFPVHASDEEHPPAKTAPIDRPLNGTAHQPLVPPATPGRLF